MSRTLRLGHSPDPDDAFMWWPLADFTAPNGQRVTPQIDTAGYQFHHVLEDIQSLNERCEHFELEITALSIHQYAFVASHYALTTCGSSMGDGYGPMIVARQPITSLKGRRLAIPGRRTTAWLAAQLWLMQQGLTENDLDAHVVMFDQIIPAVASGQFDAGLIIHEGQLTYAQSQLQLIVDLGAWWTQRTSLPLPLGGNAIRRDLVESGEAPAICRVLLRSIEHALNHRDQAVAFALQYARDMGRDLADRFVGMYVNKWTLDYGPRGREAISRLLTDAATAGLTPALPPLDFVAPAA